LNSIAERFVQTVKSECLDHFIVFGEEQLRHLVFSFQDYYDELRPHQSKDNLPLNWAAPPPTAAFTAEGIVSDERPGGLPKHYARRIA